MRKCPVVAIRSVHLGVPDVSDAEAFYTNAWGLTVAARYDGIVYLRATGRDHHVLALQTCGDTRILSISFRTATRDALDSIQAKVAAGNGRVIHGVSTNHEPDGGVVLTVETPEGYVLRFHHGDVQVEVENRSCAFPYRLSHVNLNCANIEASTRFFENVLGFELTDRSKAMVFLRCNQDHHAVVLADSGVDGLNHIAFMMPDLESVMRGSGRMIMHGYPIGWGVGRHGPGDNVFAYFVDVFGFVVEYTAEVMQIEEGYKPHGPDYWVWPPGRTDHWGIAPPKPGYVKDAQLAIQFAPCNRKLDRSNG